MPSMGRCIQRDAGVGFDADADADVNVNGDACALRIITTKSSK